MTIPRPTTAVLRIGFMPFGQIAGSVSAFGPRLLPAAPCNPPTSMPCNGTCCDPDLAICYNGTCHPMM
jgi:hypothetical protein